MDGRYHSKARRLDLRELLPSPLPPGEPGDPGVFATHDVLWPIAAERLNVLGSFAALLMQVAHPLIAEAVVAHSDYRAVPTQRLLRTGQFMLTRTFGDTAQARAAVAALAHRHRAVTGTTTEAVRDMPAGTRYSAADPKLALWVRSTLTWSTIAVHERYGQPLDEARRAALWEQSQPSTGLLGVTDAAPPADWTAFTTYWDHMVSSLEVSRLARRIAADLLHPRFTPPLPGVGHMARIITTDLLPAPIRAGYRLPYGRPQRVQARGLRTTVRALRPLVPDRYAQWPHYRQALQRTAAASSLAPATPTPSASSQRGRPTLPATRTPETSSSTMT